MMNISLEDLEKYRNNSFDELQSLSIEQLNKKNEQ